MSDKIAAVFPGQGAQRPGMGQDFCENNESANKIYEEASNAINEDVKVLCFTENEKLNLTEFTQPAILTTEIAILTVLKEKYSFSPSLFAGHSLGEYSALVAAGVIPFSDAVKIVRKRGALMQAAVPEGVGTMAALLIDDIEKTNFEKITADSGAEVANYNSAGQIVISGKKEAMEKATEALANAYPDMRIVMLPVSAPFHSSLMKDIEGEFIETLQQLENKFDKSRCTSVLSNFTGDFHQPDTLLKNLVAQISGSVKWIQNMKVLIEASNEIIEVGPNKVLTKFFATMDCTVPAIINERSAKKRFAPES